ncbi:hypothetical protein GCM10011297_05090 [Bacterioplanes sanyensis]|uniref:DUF3135 domain-containing protein n=1 Tax=Bacterioplanes sanyensis TaxID=1249553 RepID=UPI001678E333|nr:DUF3135 domain-containing protein [Bacterioplanes sanyensis]GGY35000.1 hypothetical protein GCM10011297_05090 [Bacterioplanes sanyensis]
MSVASPTHRGELTELPDPEELHRLAEQQPEALEALRQQMVQQLIDHSPQRLKHRLQGLQFRIDMERQRCKTPMAACLKLSGMMHDSLGDLQSALIGDYQPPERSAASVTCIQSRAEEQPKPLLEAHD